jgi:hypothetical protein
MRAVERRVTKRQILLASLSAVVIGLLLLFAIAGPQPSAIDQWLRRLEIAGSRVNNSLWDQAMSELRSRQGEWFIPLLEREAGLHAVKPGVYARAWLVLPVSAQKNLPMPVLKHVRQFYTQLALKEVVQMMSIRTNTEPLTRAFRHPSTRVRSSALQCVAQESALSQNLQNEIVEMLLTAEDEILRTGALAAISQAPLLTFETIQSLVSATNLEPHITIKICEMLHVKKVDPKLWMGRLEDALKQREKVAMLRGPLYGFVQRLSESQDEEVRARAKKLLAHW